LKPRQVDAVCAATDAALEKHAAANASLIATSSQTGGGTAELRAEIAMLAAAHGAMRSM
jgi:hypothetical protein